MDARSDIFSFGSVLYEMVTGQRAFQGDSKMSILAAVLNQEPKPASEISRALPQDLEKIITRCLRKDPEPPFPAHGRFEGGPGGTQGGIRLRLLQRRRRYRFFRKAQRVSLLRWVTLVVLLFRWPWPAWFWFGRSEQPPPEGPLTAVPLTAYPGWELSPSFSPDGKQVAFAQAEREPKPQESTSSKMSTSTSSRSEWKSLSG